MPSPTSALLWEIWRRHRSTVALLAVITAAGRFVDLLDGSGRAGNAGGESSPLTTLLGMTAFLLLLSVLNYTESSGARAVGQFPRRLFTLPVTSLRLVAVPVLAAIAAIELLYLLWMEPLSRGGTASGPFVAVLLAALVVFYLWALWTLERAGAMRLLVLGAVAISLFAAGLLPSFPPGPPPAWRSEAGVAALVAALALAAFMHAWRHVSLLRSGDVSSVRRGSLADWIPGTRPAPRQAFSGPEAAHLWYEWRLSGWVLPALVAGVVVAIVLPASWLVRSDEAETFRLLLAALAAPVVLAVPVESRSPSRRSGPRIRPSPRLSPFVR